MIAGSSLKMGVDPEHRHWKRMLPETLQVGDLHSLPTSLARDMCPMLQSQELRSWNAVGGWHW